MLSLLLLASALAAPPAGDLFVAPGGDDGNPGTLERPLRTLERARDEVRRRLAAGTDHDLLVILRGGRYELPAPLRFGPEDSGAGARSVTYAAYPLERPVLSGGRRISGWKRGAGEIWTAEIPLAKEGKWHPRQLFVDGRRAQRARTPNEGFFRIEGASSQEKPFRLHYRGRDIKAAWAGDGETEVVALLAWADLRMPIVAVDEGARIATLSGDPRDSNRENDARYFIENAPDGLDAPGEWRLDRRAGLVSYWPRPGEDLAKAETIAPALTELVRIEGDPAAGRPVRNLRFRNLVFSHTDWTLAPRGYADAQSAIAIGGALRADGAVGCALEGCVFREIAGYGIELARGCKGNRIERCEVVDAGAGGVRIGEGSQREAEVDRTEGNIVTDCHLHVLGRVFPPAVGVWVGQSSGNTIAHNEIDDLYYTAISVGWTWGYGPNLCRGNLIEWNHLHHIGQEMLSDLGGIYTLGVQPGTVLRGNHIHHVSSFTYGGWGIYPDEGSSEILIEKNVVHDTKSAGFHQHYGRENLVRNNIFAFGKEHQLMRSRAEGHRSFTLERNIVYWMEGDLLGSVWGDAQYLLDRNLYWKEGGGEIRFGSWSFEEWKGRGQDRASRIADPLFVDPAGRDFHLRPGSPALELGFEPIDISQAGPRAATGSSD